LTQSWPAVFYERREPFDWGYLAFTQNYYRLIPFFLVSWSLCIEEHIYFFLPLLLTLLSRSRRSVTLFFTMLTVMSPMLRWFVSLRTDLAGFGYAHTATHLRMEGLLLGFLAAYLPSY